MEKLEDLINGCKRNDRKSQKEIYSMFCKKMFAVCLQYSSSYTEAEDNLQEGFMLIFEKIDKFNFKGSFEGWIRRVLVNMILQKYRKKSPLLYVENIFDISPETDEEPVEDTNIDSNTLLKFVSELPPGYRLVFNLYVMEKLKHDEIAEKLGISSGTSKSNLARARKILKRKINEYYSVRNGIVSIC